jgi:molybdopterin synthase sulfur carrier subunit
MARVRIPTPLRTLTGGQAEVEASGATVREVLADLEQRFPGFKDRIYDDSGELRRFVNLYVDEEDIRFAEGLDTAIRENSVISIVPAVAGGR